MIEGKKLPSPTKQAMVLLKTTMENIDPDEKLVEAWGIPQLFAVIQSTVQGQMRQAGLSGVAQMRWYQVEKELLHVVRLLYSDLTEEQIIETYGPPDNADERCELELEKKTRELRKHQKPD